MTAAAVVSVLLIPLTRINADMTSNLPDDSQMRRGLTILEEYFPQMDIRMQTLRVMFVAEPPADSLQQELDAMLPGSRRLDIQQHDAHTLYQYMLPTDMDGVAVRERILDRFGDRVILELDDNSGMPDNLLVMIATGVLTGVLILFLMCPSFIEPLLILLTLAIAILINMGTNALLPSVRLITHTLVAVLQLVLSMDYAIILMNRYRQEKQRGLEKRPAMVAAIASAAPAILSSGLTTIVSLLMLCFMRLKIGADLGIVLSKGVLCSLIATFTVLPALIVWCDKAITKTRKRVPQIPTDGLARFELRQRIPLAILFLGLFIGSWFLQRRTEISYSVVWPTPITEEFPSDNLLLMLYPTEKEAQMVAIADSIATLEEGVTCISYPSIALKPRTARELSTELGSLSPDLAGKVPEDMVDLLYYAASHPERNERMRIDQLKPTADSLLAVAAQVLPEEALAGIASRFDINRLMKQLVAIPVDIPAPAGPAPEAVAEPAPAPESQMADESNSETEVLPEISTKAEENVEAKEAEEVPESVFTYEQLTKQRTAAEMAEALQYDSKQISTVYRIAGVGRKGTLSIKEFFDVISNKVLGNRLYAAMISSETAAEFRAMKKRVDAVIKAGPTKPETPPADVTTPDTPVIPDNPPVKHTDTTIPAAKDTVKTDSTHVKEPTVAPATKPEPVVEELSPIERLADMAFSGKAYSASQVYRALSRAGVPVSRDEIDLLYLFHGYQTARDTTTRLTLTEMADYLGGLAENPLVARYADSTQLASLSGIKQQLEGELGALRGDPWSLAVITSDLPVESEQTFRFIDGIRKLSLSSLGEDPYLIGHSQMYKEIKEGFPRELLVLTLLTIAALFLIVALTFRSVIVPFLLIPTVLMAVWLNVFASGLGGHPMLFLAYLIVQGILMGATIDYSILFTHNYQEARRTQDRGAALASAYRSSIHAILTSGSILVLAPWFMTLVIHGEMIVSILRSISAGAFAAILLILFILPGTLALMDKWVVPSKGLSC